MNFLDSLECGRFSSIVLRDVSTVVGFGWVQSSEAPSQRYEELESWCPQSDHATEKRMS